MRPRPVTAIVAANLRRQARDKVGLFFMVIMPFVTILFVGLALGGNAVDSTLPVGVVAQESDPTSAAVLRELNASPDLEVDRFDSAEEVRDGVRRGDLAAGLVMAAGEREFELVVTQTNGSGMVARRAIDVAVGKVSAVMEATSAATGAGATSAQAQDYVRAAQDESADVAVRSAESGSETPRGFAYTAPANLLLFTFINSMAVAAALVESRRLGMLSRTLTAPIHKRRALLGEATSRLVIAGGQAALIVTVSALMFNVDWGDPLGVAVIIGLFCLVATGAAMLVGALVRQPQQAPAIGPPVGIVLGMLGGCLWPSEVAGEPLNTIGHLFPHAWGMDALLTLSRPGTGLGSVLLEVGVLAAMAAALLAASVHMFGRRALAH